MLFDRDEDGVLSFQELQLVMKSMGQRPSGLQRSEIQIQVQNYLKVSKIQRSNPILNFDSNN